SLISEPSRKGNCSLPAARRGGTIQKEVAPISAPQIVALRATARSPATNLAARATRRQINPPAVDPAPWEVSCVVPQAPHPPRAAQGPRTSRRFTTSTSPSSSNTPAALVRAAAGTSGVSEPGDDSGSRTSGIGTLHVWGRGVGTDRDRPCPIFPPTPAAAPFPAPSGRLLA